MVEAKRRAPKSGYESEAKKEYRRNVWDSLLSGGRVSGKILILPSKEGFEIDHLVQERGIPQCDIIAIDESAALIASAPWRKKYKSIKCYGVKASEVHKRLKNVRISYANLDLCNNFSEELVSEVGEFLSNAPINKDDFSFAVTVSKGRESSVTNYLMNHIMGQSSFRDHTNFEEKRLSCLFKVLNLHSMSNHETCLLGEGKYINNKTPMAWGALRLSNVKTSREFSRLYSMIPVESALRRVMIQSLPSRYITRIEKRYIHLAKKKSLKEIKSDIDLSCDIITIKMVKNGDYDKFISLFDALKIIRESNESEFNSICEKYPNSFRRVSMECQSLGGGTVEYWERIKEEAELIKYYKSVK